MTKKVVQIEGPLTKKQTIEFVEEIINNDKNTLIDVSYSSAGSSMHTVMIIYETKVEEKKKGGVK